MLRRNLFAAAIVAVSTFSWTATAQEPDPLSLVLDSYDTVPTAAYLDLLFLDPESSLHRLATDEQRSVSHRVRASSLLSYYPTDDAWRALLDIASEGHPEVRADAYWTLAWTFGESRADTLVPVWAAAWSESRDAVIRRALVRGARYIRHQDITELLEGWAQDVPASDERLLQLISFILEQREDMAPLAAPGEVAP